MDPATIGLIMGLIAQGPEMIAFVTHTYQLFSAGKLTADELQALWVNTGNAVRAAEAKWAAAATGDKS